MMDCLICHNSVRIPVRFMCFKCQGDGIGRPVCNSVIRVCLFCAREYLQLNRRRHEREQQKKCLTCSATVHLPSLYASKAYEKDFLLMSLDKKSDYACPHAEQGCLFTGCQNDLDRHIMTSCSFREKKCKFCPSFYAANREEAHKMICPNHELCSQCVTYIPTIEKEEHDLVVHQTRKCLFCEENVPTVDYVAHSTSVCPRRPDCCPFCSLWVMHCTMEDHLDQHVTDTLSEIQRRTQDLSRYMRYIKFHRRYNNSIDGNNQPHR